MAKPLQFVLNAETFDGVPVKLERSKLYGHVDTVATDAACGVCISASLDSAGTLVIPPPERSKTAPWMKKGSGMRSRS